MRIFEGQELEEVYCSGKRYESSTAAPRKPRQAAKAAKKAIKRSSCKSIQFILQFLYINYNTLVSYKEETLSSAVEDLMHHILERLDDIFESKSLISLLYLVLLI